MSVTEWTAGLQADARAARMAPGWPRGNRGSRTGAPYASTSPTW